MIKSITLIACRVKYLAPNTFHQYNLKRLKREIGLMALSLDKIEQSIQEKLKKKLLDKTKVLNK